MDKTKRENQESSDREGRQLLVRKAWTKNTDEVLSASDVSRDKGLSAHEAKSRIRTYGRNVLEESEKRSTLDILISQFKSLIMLLLALAAGLSFAFGQWVDGIAIIVAIGINVLIGFFTELKAVRSMEALQSMNTLNAVVLRDGEQKEISSKDLVPGDIVILETGNVVTADLRIIQTTNLQINESPLTGESVPVSKTVETLEQDVPLAERKNMAFKGTAVTRGDGLGVVVATGMNTEIGNISSMVQKAEEEEDPLQKRLNKLSRKLIWVILIVAVAASIAGFISGKELFLMIETAIVLVVAAIPEGLPVVATVALARGMHMMAKRNALVSRLSAVQTLGSTTVIFTDKTGTLTENQMTVKKYALADGTFDVSGEGLSREGEFSKDGSSIKPQENEILKEALKVGVLCTNASLSGRNGNGGNSDKNRREGSKGEGDQNVTGDPMEIALLIAGAKAGFQKEELLQQMEEIREVAFDPDKKMMATYHRTEDGKLLVAVKGAPQAVVEHCSEIRTRDGRSQMSREEEKKWIQKNDELAGQGLRMLALAEKVVESQDEAPYENLTFLGMAALLDPPRREVKQPITECKEAGIRVVMVTGDHAITAKNIGKEIGLVESDEADVVEGKSLKPPKELSSSDSKRILSAPVFARVSPEQKLNLIELYQENGEIAAMTGDGVNDAPALKTADIGIAMGKRGEDVAKEAADIILKDDAFSTIVTAVRHGRAIFNNIRKFVLYLISGNIGEIMIVGFAAMVGAPLPLLPLQILYLNAINDVFPALALGMGKEGKDVMKQPPRDPREAIMTKYHWFEVAGYGAVIAASVLGVFAAALLWLGFSEEEAVTVSFLSLALGRLWHVFNMRDRGSGLFRNQVVKNGFVWGALGISTALIVLAVFIPGLSSILDVTTPDPTMWLLVAIGSLVPLVLGQLWNSLAPKDKWVRD